MPKSNPVVTAIQTLCVLTMVAGTADAASVSTEKAKILKIEEIIATSQTAAALYPYFDKKIIFYDLVPGVVRGNDTYNADLTGQFAAIRDFRNKIVEISIEADGHLAFAFSLQKATWTNNKSNKEVTIAFRQTDCYRKESGKWMLVHEHDSVPFNWATGKAVLDDTP